MKAGPNSNRIRQDFSFKRSLMRLNRDLDRILWRVDKKFFDHVWHSHSHNIELGYFSKLQKAILYLEDRRFLVHRGFEFRAPLRVLKRILLGKRTGAISTVDQQLVRICTGRYERTIRRKVREALLAFLLNSHRSKAKILYTYLHDSYFGYRLEGCETTSRFLFSKPATDLSTDEACFIAALLARPLPKKVFDRVAQEKTLRIMTPEYLIHLGDLEQLDWSENVRKRYQYVRLMFSSIPNSLRTR